jgi:hypothetical protein
VTLALAITLTLTATLTVTATVCVLQVLCIGANGSPGGRGGSRYYQAQVTCRTLLLLHCSVLYCTVLYCTVLYCIVLYCVPCCAVPRCTVPHTVLCYVLYCTVLSSLHCTALFTVLHYTVFAVPTAMHCGILCSTVRHRTVIALHFTAFTVPCNIILSALSGLNCSQLHCSYTADSIHPDPLHHIVIRNSDHFRRIAARGGELEEIDPMTTTTGVLKLFTKNEYVK